MEDNFDSENSPEGDLQNREVNNNPQIDTTSKLLIEKFEKFTLTSKIDGERRMELLGTRLDTIIQSLDRNFEVLSGRLSSIEVLLDSTAGRIRVMERDILKLSSKDQPVPIGSKRRYQESPRSTIPRSPHREEMKPSRAASHSKIEDCLICGMSGHKAVACRAIANYEDRKSILLRKKKCIRCLQSYERGHRCPPIACPFCPAAGERAHHGSMCHENPFFSKP